MQLKDRVITAISYYKNPLKRETIELARTFEGKTGIEIGGPSGVFGLKSFFPVYLYAARIDGVNFSNETVWEGKIGTGKHYAYYPGKPEGFQYINEAADLIDVPENHYDFLLSCHSLEHVANPIKALRQWKKVLKDQGSICLVLPDKRYTFDHKRPYTTFDHLLSDEANGVDERDTTHFEEVLQLHDLSKDIAQTRAEFESRTLQNYTKRCIHHHIYSLELMEQLLNYCGFKVSYSGEFAPFHLMAVAQKVK
ncbi:MAG TPA: methyltransferase domain-containing protein [Arachidicoccus sp.]|nr:methyltransferase domain-containing protein [Arachidicoccus sp.]